MNVLPNRRLGDRVLVAAVLGVPLLGLALFLLYPLVVIGSRSFTDTRGALALDNYRQLWSGGGFVTAAVHSVVMSLVVTALSVVAGFVIAFTLYRSRVPGKRLIRGALLLPILAPSLMQGLGLIFLLGRAGLLHRWTGWNVDIYGFWGLSLANLFYALPQVVLVVSASLERIDQRYYDSAEVMGASRWRQFVDITLPNARFGLLAAAFVVFTVTMTDFGNAIVVGGNYRVLATEIYGQVAGQMNFGMGATIGIVLLLPAVLSVYIERVAAKRQLATVAEAAMKVEPPANRLRDIGLAAAVAVMIVPIVAIVAVVIYASFVKLWPYRLELTFDNYHVNLAEGYAPILTSLKISLITGVVGTLALFLLALGMRELRGVFARCVNFIAMLPAAVPGMVLGIGYLVSFNTGPLSAWLYGSTAIIVLCNFYHYHTQAFLTMVGGLRSVPPALEEAVSCLGAGSVRRVGDVVMPYVASSLLSVFFFLFMRSMVTLSGVIFLVTPTLNLAAVSAMQLDVNGSVAQAAAYSTCILVVVALALLAMHVLVGRIAMHLQRSRYVA
jgi:iron(III) transport system permease protein